MSSKDERLPTAFERAVQVLVLEAKRAANAIEELTDPLTDPLNDWAALVADLRQAADVCAVILDPYGSTHWLLTLETARHLRVAGPWKETRLRRWVRSVVWRPRLDAPCPVIDLDGYATLVTPDGARWEGYNAEGRFDRVDDAKAEEDRLLRDDGWILTDAEPSWAVRGRDGNAGEGS